MTVVLGVVVGLVLLLAAALALQSWLFYRREEGWRERERQLVDRLLRQARVEPLEVRRVRTLEIEETSEPNKSPIDEAFEMDDVKEELEQLHPEAHGMTVEQAMMLYPQEWREIEARLQARRRPLRRV
jgi:hypothetical protein